MMRFMRFDAEDSSSSSVSSTPNAVAARRVNFRAMHDRGFFVLPNPWDLGGVRRLERLGFRALASTSAGYAWSLGIDDRELTIEQVLDHLRWLNATTTLPINADFENGYAERPEDVAVNVGRAAETGVAALSIEDLGDDDLYDLQLAVERIRAAREALDAIDPNIVLVGRSEGHLIGRDDLHGTIERLVAYAEAGADCLYAPGIRTDDQIAAIVAAVAPKAVNVLFRSASMTSDRLAALGVRRASVGSLLAKASWRAFDDAATKLVSDGSLPVRLFEEA